MAALAALLAILSMQFNFNLSVDGLSTNHTLEMGRGESQSLNLTISGGIGFKVLGTTSIGKIYLDTVMVPSGLNASIYPNAGSPIFHSNITIHADDNATEGSKRIVFRGVGPLGSAKTLDLDLRIVKRRYFELVGDAPQITIQQNGTVAIPVHIIRDPHYLKPIYLKALGLPAGIVPIFDPVCSLPGTALSSLQLKINPEAGVGTYNLSVLGTGADNQTACCNLSLKIKPDMYFIISANPSIIKIRNGNYSLSSIELTSVNNYTGKVKLSVLKYPNNIITASFDEPIADLSLSSPKDKLNLKLHISDDAIPRKSYYVIVNGLGQDGSSANCSIMVIIEGSSGSFSIEPQFGSLQLKPGETRSSDIIIEGNNGYKGTITLSASDVPGITANIDPEVLLIDDQNSIVRSELRVHAQAEYNSSITSDMIIRGSDAKQNSDEFKIVISVLTEPSVIKPSVIQPAITQEISPENEIPSLNNLSPLVNQIYSDQIVKFLAEARDPENDPLTYRFLLNGWTIRDWSEKNTAEISMKAGENEIEVQVIDGLHNGSDMYDDNKIIKITVHPEVPVDSSNEFTTRDEFFKEIVSKDFNYNNIPIEGASASSKDRWYRNEPSSANYVGEYEIRKELFFSKSDYTIKLVLDNMSKPIDAIFLQDSNIVSEVPSGFVEQAMRKLSNL
jgi:hypothetical protein